MSLPVPDLDDRSFEQLVAEAKLRLKQSCPAWTDLSPHDPGIALLELFAYLTDVLIYRLNRVPDKAYVEFLNLIGVRLQPPCAARVPLVFSRQAASPQAVEIRRGTRVTSARADGATPPPVFVTANATRIEAGATRAKEVLAYQCELVDAELAGTASGLPGFFVRAARPPIIAPTGDALDLVVAVEARPGDPDDGVPAREYLGKTFRVWREVENFADDALDAPVYVADRHSGLIVFAPAVRPEAAEVAATATPAEGSKPQAGPAALARVPAAGREIRLWYRRGGGPEGNVAVRELTVLKDPIAGVQVTNEEPATAGRAAETLDEAKVRGPLQLHSLKRAVTARDFEAVALQNRGAVARARAFTQASLWKHATPGTVEVVLVPNVPEQARGAGLLTSAALGAQETETARSSINAALDERRPLGTSCVVSWARYKPVRVRAKLVAHRAEDADALRQRILDRLYRAINPLPNELHPAGWPFGQPLRAAYVYDLLSEPGIADIEELSLVVGDVPDAGVSCIVADAIQPHTWYASSGPVVFRSQNDGGGWEPAGRFEGEVARLIAVHPQRAGLLAVATTVDDGTRLHLSRDCGETWEAPQALALGVTDLSWTIRDGTPVLFIAAEPLPGKQGGGLFELVLRPGAAIQQILVDPNDQNRALYAVSACTSLGGEVAVAVAMQSKGGVFLSNRGGAPGSFRAIGLDGRDARVLAVQQYGNRSFLWAGLTAAPGEEGTGCWRTDVWSSNPADDWRRYDAKWKGGSCHWLSFAGAKVIAATHRAGVLWIDDASGAGEVAWEAPATTCGLPLRVEEDRPFHPVASAGIDAGGKIVLAGGEKGVYASADGGRTYASSSRQEFSDFSAKVTLPDTWLFCSESHEIEVVSQDEGSGD